MKIKFKCLIMDHDDTAVNSTPEIHYPCYIQTVETLRPHEKILSLEEFMNACFYPGLYDYYVKALNFTREELELEFEQWQKYVASRVPHFFDGIGDIIKDFKAAGGVFAVSSQSYVKVIERDYTERLGFVPDFTYGCELPAEKCKPSPFSVLDICEKCGFAPSDVIVVDDLRTGLEMAKAAGAHFAAAGWSHIVPEISAYMKQNAEIYLRTVDDLRNVLFFS